VLGIILCCIWRKRQDRRARNGKLPPRIVYPNRLGRGGIYPPPPNAFNPLQPVELQQYGQTHPQGPMFPRPASPPPPPQHYPVPAYQIFQPQAQRAGYQHILRDEANEAIDHEVSLPEANPPPYIELADDMARGEMRE
jgi:hypothetical protein